MVSETESCCIEGASWCNRMAFPIRRALWKMDDWTIGRLGAHWPGLARASCRPPSDCFLELRSPIYIRPLPLHMFPSRSYSFLILCCCSTCLGTARHLNFGVGSFE